MRRVPGSAVYIFAILGGFGFVQGPAAAVRQRRRAYAWRMVCVRTCWIGDKFMRLDLWHDALQSGLAS